MILSSIIYLFVMIDWDISEEKKSFIERLFNMRTQK